MKKNLSLVLLALLAVSCEKYLDTKPDKKLAVASSVADLQALLDNSNIMNLMSPSLGEVSADNYWLRDGDLHSMQPIEQAVYSWDDPIFAGYPNDWGNVYNPVYYSNLALETIGSYERTEQNKSDWDNVKGSALLYRAKSFLDAAWIWCNSYDEQTAINDEGLPLRLRSDFTEPSVRSSVQQTYDQIIADLQAALPLLPEKPLHQMRPSKAAVYGYLARTYLSMREYDSCYKYVSQALALHPQLMDYNEVDVSNYNPFELFNKEVIMHSSMAYNYQNLYEWVAKIDTVLYASYEDMDLRKTLYFGDNFDGTYYFRGSYGNYLTFNGIATDELLLTRAECEARLNQTSDALKDINALLVKRYTQGNFTPYNITNTPEPLELVLQERRKELVYRSLRWMDIKRLNKEQAAITLSRNIEGQLNTLAPGANRYALPLPEDVIRLSGMLQNPK